MIKLFSPKQKILTADAGLPPSVNTTIRNLYALALLMPFPPSSTDPRILLSDWSHFQGDVDIGKHLAYGPPKFQGTIIRSGQGKNASYDDTQFRASVQKCEANGFPWMGYHVLIPLQNTDEQIDHVCYLYDGLEPRWIWWDVQVHNNQTKRHISNATIRAVERTKVLTSIETGVYSAQWFTKGFMEIQDWFSEIIWWIAQWLWPDQRKEHPWPTALPETVDISQVMIQQTTSWGDGRLVGMESQRLDLNRWMWTKQQFNEIMGTIIPPPLPDDHIELWEAIRRLGDNATIDRAQLEHLIQWAKVLQIAYIEA